MRQQAFAPMKVAATVLDISKSLTVTCPARFRVAKLHPLYPCAKMEPYSTSLYADQGPPDKIFIKFRRLRNTDQSLNEREA